MKNKKEIKTVLLSSLIGLSSCVNGQKPKSSGANSPTESGELRYLYQDVAPEQYGGTWKRVWSLTGPYAGDLAIDEMRDKEGDNWQEIARSNRDGVFIQKDTTLEVRYRFDGHLETPWMPALTDTLISALPSNGEYKGHRCIIPTGQVIYIGSNSLKIECTEIIIEGDVYAFGGTDAGQGAGAVELNGEKINVTGRIHLIGERGVPGRNGSNASGGRVSDGGTNCSNGTNGQIGGRGGTIFIKGDKSLHIADDTRLKVSGGPGGGGGRAGNGRGNCRNGAQGPNGSDGIIQIFKPDLREEAN